MENPIRIDIELPKSRKTKGILKLLGLKDNHSKEWVTLFECPALGTSLKGMTGVSRTMETLNPTYERLWPNQDTPQGIYRLEGLMHNHGLTNAPYLNIDNADNPIMLPVECGHHHNNHHDTLDFWHEKILAMALGRYAIRIHGHSLNDQHKLVDGMQTTNGCIQIGDNVHALIDMLVQHNVAPRDMTNHIIQNNGKKLEWNEAMIKCPVVIWDGG